MMKKSKYKIAFFGTPEFSVPILKTLFESEDFEVALVVTQPDRPSGRNLKLTPSPVKVWALSNNLKVISPESCKTDHFIEEFKSLNIEACVVVAFGQILNQKLLNLCPDKFVNIHASLLPHLRGAAPIQRSIMMGDIETGVSLQVMVKKLDAGDVISEIKTKILPHENAIELHDRLSILGSELLKNDLKDFLNGKINSKPQNEQFVTYASKIEKNETWIDWNLNAQQIWNHIRGLALGPGGTTNHNGRRLKIIRAEPLSALDLTKLDVLLDSGTNKKPGSVVKILNEGFVVACGEDSFLLVTSVQPESKPVMTAKAFLNNGVLKEQDQFIKS